MSNLRDMRVYCKLNTGKVPNLSTSLSGKYLDLILSFSGTQTNVGSFLRIHSKSYALKENMIYSISRSCQKNIQRRTEKLFIASISHLAMCTCSVWEKKKFGRPLPKRLTTPRGWGVWPHLFCSSPWNLVAVPLLKLQGGVTEFTWTWARKTRDEGTEGGGEQQDV